MAKITSETPSTQKAPTSEGEVLMLVRFNSYIKELQDKRKETAEAHENHLRENPPRGIGPYGSVDVYALSMQIEAAIEVGKRLGLVPESADPDDYL